MLYDGPPDTYDYPYKAPLEQNILAQAEKNLRLFVGQCWLFVTLNVTFNTYIVAMINDYFIAQFPLILFTTFFATLFRYKYLFDKSIVVSPDFQRLIKASYWFFTGGKFLYKTKGISDKALQQTNVAHIRYSRNLVLCRSNTDAVALRLAIV